MGSYRLEDDPHYQDVLFFETHHEELLQQYPDKWIAIWNKKVVASAQNESGLTPQTQGDRSPKPAGVLIQEMETDPKPWILSPP